MTIILSNLNQFTRSQVHWGSLIELRVSDEPRYAKLSHFGEVLHSKSLGFVPKKLNTTTGNASKLQQY